MSQLMSNFFQRMSISDTPKYANKLSSLNVEGVANYLQNCKNVICMLGAGVSTCKL